MSAEVPTPADHSVLGSARADGATRRVEIIDDWLSRTGLRLTRDPGWMFRTVLPRLSEADFQRFSEADPVVIDLDRTLAAVTYIVRRDLPCRVPVICINVGVGELRDGSYLGVVGHEVAHLVLGHLESRRSSAEKHEEVAQKLAEWGLSDRLVAAPGGGEYLLLQTLKADLDAALVELSYGLEEASLDDLSDTLAKGLHIVEGLLRRQQAARVCAGPVRADEAPVRSGAADQPSVSPGLGPTLGESYRREGGAR